MKKLFPYLLVSIASLNAILGISPVLAMGCGFHSDKSDAVCDVEDSECKNKTSAKANN